MKLDKIIRSCKEISNLMGSGLYNIDDIADELLESDVISVEDNSELENDLDKAIKILENYNELIKWSK